LSLPDHRAAADLLEVAKIGDASLIAMSIGVQKSPQEIKSLTKTNHWPVI
jgi:hypothetical protein